MLYNSVALATVSWTGVPDSNWVSLITFVLGEKERMFLYVAEPEVGKFGSWGPVMNCSMEVGSQGSPPA